MKKKIQSKKKPALKKKAAAPKRPVAVKKTAPKVSKKPAASAKAASKQTAPAKNSSAIGQLTAKELAEIKSHLKQMKQDIVARIQEKKNLDMPEAEVGDPIDQASQSLDKEILFEVSDNDYKMLDQIEATLRRMEKGIYGSCQGCGRTIPVKRLRTLPFARYCIACQSTTEVALPD